MPPLNRARLRGWARTSEAIVLLSLAAAAQKWVPMTRWSRVLGGAEEPPAEWQGAAVKAIPSRAADLTERRVASSVRRAGHLLPFDPTCLAEATAGQVMLRRRGHPGVVVIGLRRGLDSWDAHAWLIGDEGALTGGPAARGFTATTVFRVRP